MKTKNNDDKTIFSIRVPPLVNKKIVERAENIGISKSAVILNLLYKEFMEGKEEQQRNGNYWSL